MSQSQISILRHYLRRSWNENRGSDL